MNTPDLPSSATPWADPEYDVIGDLRAACTWWERHPDTEGLPPGFPETTE
jgi:hypothetical protein